MEPLDPEFLARVWPTVERLVGDGAFDEAFAARLAASPTRTLVLFGRDDGVINPINGRTYRRLMKNSTLQYVYSAAHDIQGDRPEAFAETVGDFLRRGMNFMINETRRTAQPLADPQQRGAARASRRRHPVSRLRPRRPALRAGDGGARLRPPRLLRARLLHRRFAVPGAVLHVRGAVAGDRHDDDVRRRGHAADRGEPGDDAPAAVPPGSRRQAVGGDRRAERGPSPGRGEHRVEPPRSREPRGRSGDAWRARSRSRSR